MGVPPIIHFNGIFHEINQPAIGDPPDMETPMSRDGKKNSKFLQFISERFRRDEFLSFAIAE